MEKKLLERERERPSGFSFFLSLKKIERTKFKKNQIKKKKHHKKKNESFERWWGFLAQGVSFACV